ncbi:hypothetical protein [Aequoribacter sp.]|uniref:hypothetical protein n=2 Tax=Aequoribacter sp. TaxID=2847771 RepID=UPI003C67B503
MIYAHLRRVFLCLVLISSVASQAADRYKPFVLAYTSDAAFEDVVSEVKSKLQNAGFELLTDYRPYDGASALVVSSSDLKALSNESKLSGFAATLRVGVNQVEDGVQVSYLNPEYLGKAYRIESDMGTYTQALAATLGEGEAFGSRKGLTEKKLRKYHYTFGMEYFDDPYVLGVFSSQQEALDAVRTGLANNTVGVSSLYEVTLDRANSALFGVSMVGEGEDDKYHDDAYQMSIVDFKEHKSSAYLPYQVLVVDGEVLALHMRFRMAVHFPDLSMMGKHSFMTLMPSPKAIHGALTAAVNGE